MPSGHVTQFLKNKVAELNETFNASIDPQKIENFSEKISDMLSEFASELLDEDEDLYEFFEEHDEQGYLICEFEEKILSIVKGNLF